MHSNGSIPVDKNMDEILASIRQTIQEDLNDGTQNNDLYPSGIKSSDQLLNDKKNSGTDVLELTQMLSDDGTIVNLEAENARKTPQTILRRPYSPLDRTPLPDLRHYPDSYAKKTIDKDDYDCHGQFDDRNYNEETIQDRGHTVASIPIDLMTPSHSKSEDITPFETVMPTSHYSAGLTNSITTHTEEHIMSDKTIQDSLAALGSLNMSHSIKDDHNSSTLSSQQTVENLVRELLRPLLKEWLDANLPTLVKWVVTEQVERVFKQQQNSSHR